MRNVITACCALTLSLVAAAAAAQANGGSTLPLKRVRLYDTGVGYFERAGHMNAAKAVSLPVPAGHLDDALKTLVVLSEDGETSVKGIEFRASASRPLALALAGLPADPASPLTHDGLLRSLKGATVELRTARGAHRGRLIDVLAPRKEAAEECASLSKIAANETGAAGSQGLDAWFARCAGARSATLLLLTDQSEIRRFHGPEVTSVRPTDPAFRSRLSTALDALSQRGAQTRRQLHLQAHDGKSVTLGYVAEAPIWRATYRLVLGQQDGPSTLQGWALLHNDTDEPWQAVQVELVNGQPDSFLFPLAAPRYARRDLVTPERQLFTVPQLLDTTIDNMWSGESIGESFGAGGLGLTGIGEGGGGHGEGVGYGSIATIGHGAGSGPVQSGVLNMGDLAKVAEAEGVESGALFRYALPSPVTLRAHGSALLPYLHRAIRARRIAVFAAPGESARSAAHLTNDTPQTLPPGTIAVFADGGFAGESGLSRTKPSESRIIGFGFDLDVELTQQGSQRTDTPQVLAWRDETLTVHFVRHHHVTYQLVNRGGASRTVYLKLNFVRNSRITGADDTAYDSENDAAFAVFEVKPKHRGNREVDVHEGLQRVLTTKELTVRRLESLARADALPSQQRTVLREAAGLLREAAKLRKAIQKAQRSIHRADAEATRLGEMVRTVGAGAPAEVEELVERYIAAEQRTASLQRKRLALRSKARAKRQQALKSLRKLRATGTS